MAGGAAGEISGLAGLRSLLWQAFVDGITLRQRTAGRRSSEREREYGM
jgi:hypothetical protein